MNLSPFAALGWEIFGRNSSALLMNAAIAVALGIAVNFGGLAGPMNIMLLVSFSLLLSSSFAYVDLNPRSPRAGFPRHILVLPLATWMLALVPILGGAAFISAFVLLWLRFISGIHLSFVGQLQIAAGITALSCWMQAMSWELIRIRLAKLAVLAVVSGLVMLSLASLLPEDELFLGRAVGAVLLLATMSIGYGLAWLAVVRSRRGDAGEPGSSNKRLRTHSTLYLGSSRMPALRSGVAAQEWYEGRVFGRLLPVCLSFFCAIALSMLFFDGIRSKPSVIEMALVLITFVMASPLVGSAYAWKSPHVPRAMLTPFFAALPLDDVELALAKLRVSVRGHLLGVAIVLVTLAAIFLISDNNVAVDEAWTWLKAHQGTGGAYCAVLLLALFATVATWTAGAFLMTAALHFAAIAWKSGSWKYLLVVLVLLPVMNYSGWFRLNRHNLELWLAHADIVASVLLAAWLIVAADSLRAYGRAHPMAALGKIPLGFIAVTALALGLIWQLDLSAKFGWATSCLAVATALSTMIPILRMPLVIGMNRHA